MMNATNIMPRRPATMFSARRLIQATAFAMFMAMTWRGPQRAARAPRSGLHRVDLVEQARRPRLGLVRRQVDLLRVGAKRIHVRCVHIEAQLLELLDQSRLALQVLCGA